MMNLGGAAVAEPTATENGTFKKLKPGPGLSREAVATDQKLRLRRALSSMTAEEKPLPASRTRLGFMRRRMPESTKASASENQLLQAILFFIIYQS